MKVFNSNELCQISRVKLKICTTGNIFGKICLNTISDTFSQKVLYNQGKDGVRHEGKRERTQFFDEVDTQQKGEVQDIKHD